MARLPEDQRCQFLNGPVNSWFMPSTTDIWSQPKRIEVIENKQENEMDCDGAIQTLMNNNQSNNLSYFIYGSTGCFCYGQIHHNPNKYPANHSYIAKQQHPNKSPPLAVSLNRLIDIKEDNSRVACARYLKTCQWPLAMILTESGSFIIHDCLSSKNLIHFRKSELIQKFIEPLGFKEPITSSEPGKKRPKFNVTQQINSCLWANAKNAFLGFSLLREKTILLLWLKMNDLSRIQDHVITKSDLIESYKKVDLDLGPYSCPICCMEMTMINSKICLIAIATDDGLITVVNIDLENEIQSERVIKLKRHNDQICSLSFSTDNTNKFPLGLLASVSRDGLALVWDVHNEFNFADYQATSDGGKYNPKINWFALSFIKPKENSKRVNLALTNLDSALTILELPENARSKMRLKGKKQGAHSNHNNDHTLRHHALIFNIAYDSTTDVIMTSSLDGNHLFWDITHKSSLPSNSNNIKNSEPMIEIHPRYLYASMPNNSKTHMLRFNQIREDLIAMALGKAGVRFHNISNNPFNHRFDMTPSCALISRKINKASVTPTSIAWHPSNEYRIAIGTLEGKVFRADLTPRRATLVEAEHLRILQPESKVNYCQPKLEGVWTDDLFGVEYTPLEHGSEIMALDKGDVLSNKNKLDRSKNPPKTDGVYSMCWGPNPTCPEDISRLAIYAIGSISHRLFIYYKKDESSDKMTNFLDDFLDKSLPEATDQSSEVSWKSDMSLMAVGTTLGKIIIMNYAQRTDNDVGKKEFLFNRLVEIQGPLGQSYIQCLAWHPTTDKDNFHYYYLASTANDSPAFVFDVRENVLVSEVKNKLKIQDSSRDMSVNQDILLNETTANIISTYIYKLDGHKKTISDMAWNPHKANELATSSFDRHCHVWILNSKAIDQDAVQNIAPSNAKIASTFIARDRLFTLEWSLVDEDLIFSSGHDSTVWAWRSSENPAPVVK